MATKPQILKDLAEVVQKIIHKESKKDPEKRKWGKEKNRYCQTLGPVLGKVPGQGTYRGQT